MASNVLGVKLRERDIERTCTAFLELDGWRCIKTDPVSDRRRGKGFGEIGMADCLYIRYTPGRSCREEAPMAEVMWIEWKRPRGKAMPHQLAWRAREYVRGALALIAGSDFEPTFEGFQRWYFARGLARKVRAKKAEVPTA